MNRFILLILLFLLNITILLSNNVRITSTPQLVDPSPLDRHVFITFDMSWDNSWRNSTNYDAVWVFVKYRKNNGVWNHAYLDINASSYTVTNNNGINALFEPGINDIGGTNKGVGVFAQRNDNGTGNINWEGIRLKWNYGNDGVQNYDSVEVQVFAIEMVYVPQGSFYIGDGSSFSRFHEGNSASIPFQVTNSTISFGTGAGQLWASSSWDAPTGNLNTSFPTGYESFFCMKYSITQEQYVAFLNTLTRVQQNERTASDLAQGVTGANNYFVMSNSSTPFFRNGIRCNNSIDANAPIQFYCDLNNNNTANENNDGLHIACNYLSWADGSAYLAWSGLRPMTETEFEKTCRGQGVPTSGAYAWGNTTISGAQSIINAGTPDEKANTGANCVYNNATGVEGPLRVGAFATSSSSRQDAGAAFYGAMELSGNLWERTVSLGSAAGRNYTGINGIGTLNTQGNATVSNWPNVNAIGSGLRGNHWKGTSFNATISGRDNGNFETASRNEMFGFRGVRTN